MLCCWKSKRRKNSNKYCRRYNGQKPIKKTIMSNKSRIEWTEVTWNPITGCSKVSSGCQNCYAERLSLRLKAMGVKKYANGFAVTIHEDSLCDPLKWRKPKRIFVNSMSDLFHEDVPEYFIQKVFLIMAQCPQHIFQVLTKRSSRLREMAPNLNWTDNIWMGVTVEDGNNIGRISDLQSVPARVRFLSCEPLLGPINNIPLDSIDWVIVGGESGPKARKMEKDWVDEIFKECSRNNVPFFFKQWGGVRKKKAGRLFNGQIFNGMPYSFQE